MKRKFAPVASVMAALLIVGTVLVLTSQPTQAAAGVDAPARSANASTLLLADDFDYGATAMSLTVASGGNWANHSGGSPYVGYTTTSLSMAGYGSSGVGGAATILTTGNEDVNRTFITQTSGTVYYAMLLNALTAGTGAYFLHLKDAGTSLFRARVFARNDAGILHFGLSDGSTGNYITTTDFSFNTTYLLVVKYNASTGDTALYVLDTFSGTEPGTALITTTGTAQSVLAVALRQSNGGPTAIIDGVRVANTWQDVVGYVPPIEADLSVSKSGPATALAGETITYTINLSNTGSYTATGTLVTDTLPTDVTYVTYTADLPANFTQNGQDLIWDFGDMALAANATIQVQVVVSPSLMNGDSFMNTAEATSTYTETTLANNMASVTTFIGAPDLTIEKIGPASVNAGDTFTYTLTYSNAGTINATDVEIVDQLPAGVTFVTETTTSAAYANGTLTWTVGALAASAGGSIDVAVTADKAGVWVNTATIGGGPVDSDLLNNASSVTTTILGADPYVAKSGPAAAFIDRLVLYTLTYGNRGTIMATATLTDQLPAGFTVADIAADNSELPFANVGNSRVWTVDIAPNSEVSFTLALTVPTALAPSTRITNAVTISALELGDNPINNDASASSMVYEIVPISTARAGTVGEVFAVEGMVTVEPGVFTYQGQNRYMYIQDATGGVLVYRGGSLNSVARNHVVRVVGAVNEYNGETEFVPANATDVIDMGPGTAVTPLVTNTGAVDEQVEGQLVQISGQVVGAPATYRLQVNDGSGMVEVNRYYNLGTVTDPNYIDFSAYTVGDYVKVVGVTRGYSETFGFTREVLPRGPVDIAEYPRVLSVDPANGATGVSIATTLQATFNLTLTNVTSATFTMADAAGAISGIVSYDPATQMATFTPDTDLAYGTRYTATLKSALAAENGLTLMPAQDYVWSFVTYQPMPQLAFSKSVEKPASEMQLGDVVTYTLELSNSGDGAATGVLITDVLPVEVTFGGFVQQGGAVETSGAVTWGGSLNVGVTATVVFTATVGDQRAFYGRMVTNTAQFTSDNGGSDSAEAEFQIVNRYFILLPLVQR